MTTWEEAFPYSKMVINKWGKNDGIRKHNHLAIVTVINKLANRHKRMLKLEGEYLDIRIIYRLKTLPWYSSFVHRKKENWIVQILEDIVFMNLTKPAQLVTKHMDCVSHGTKEGVNIASPLWHSGWTWIS